MDFKITLGIYGAKDKAQAEKCINEMLDAYDLHDFSNVEINWMEGEDVQELCDDTTIVSDVINDCLHSLEDGEEYDFDGPIHLADGRIAKKFWVDDGNEDVRIEIWQTEPTDAWREDAFLSSMETEDAVKVAKAIYYYWD